MSKEEWKEVNNKASKIHDMEKLEYSSEKVNEPTIEGTSTQTTTMFEEIKDDDDIEITRVQFILEIHTPRRSMRSFHVVKKESEPKCETKRRTRDPPNQTYQCQIMKLNTK